jgi:maltoporin
MNQLMKGCARLGLCAIALAAAQAANAVDASGYFRAGPGSTSKGHARQCYGIASPGLKYRLGNECDIYAELILSQPMKVDNIEASAVIMTDLWNGATDAGSERLEIGQLFGTIKGVDFLPEATFWAGKRFYYANQGVHIVDTWFWKPGAGSVGAGVDDIKIPVGKFGLAYFRTDGAAADGTMPASRLHVDWSGIEVNPDGKLRVNASLSRGDFSGGKSGIALNLHHTQSNFLGLGGANELMLQYATGSANINGSFGVATEGSEVKTWRLVESPTWQVGPLGGQGLLMLAKTTKPAGETKEMSLGGRASYAVSKNVKLLAELGISSKTPPTGGKQRVDKLTVGPAIAPAADFWSRPEFRVYATFGKWNAAASADAANGLPTDKTHATSLGAQFEVWF